MKSLALKIAFIAGLAGSAYAGPAGPPAGSPILNSHIYQKGSEMNIDTATIRAMNLPGLSSGSGSCVGVDSSSRAVIVPCGTGGGGGITTLGTLTPGATTFIFNQNTLQSGATFYVAQGTVDGTLTANTQLSAVNNGFSVAAGDYGAGSIQAGVSGWAGQFSTQYPFSVLGPFSGHNGRAMQIKDTRAPGYGNVLLDFKYNNDSILTQQGGGALNAFADAQGEHFQIIAGSGNILLLDPSNVVLNRQLLVSTVNVTSQFLANGSAGTSGQLLQSNGTSAAPSWVTASSGGASTLAVATGTSSGFTTTASSPTAVIDFSSDTFNARLIGGATAFVTLNASSVTLNGRLVAGSNITLTPGTGITTIAASGGGGGVSVYPATATASFPYGFSASTGVFTATVTASTITASSDFFGSSWRKNSSANDRLFWNPILGTHGFELDTFGNSNQTWQWSSSGAALDSIYGRLTSQTNSVNEEDLETGIAVTNNTTVPDTLPYAAYSAEHFQGSPGSSLSSKLFFGIKYKLGEDAFFFVSPDSVTTFGSAPVSPTFFINESSGSAKFGFVGILTSTPTQALDVTGNVKFSGALMPNNLAGTSGQILQSNGAGAAPSWTAAGSGSPGGSTGQLQYNNGGSFGGIAGSTISTSGTIVAIQSQHAADIPISITGAPSQSGYLLKTADSSGNLLTVIDSVGDLTLSKYLNGSSDIYMSSTLVGGYGGFWVGHDNTTATGGNYAFLGNASTTLFNGAPDVEFRGNNLTGLILHNDGSVTRSVFGYAPTSASGDSTSDVSIIPFNSAYKGLVIRGASSQSANLQEWQDSSNVVLSSVTASGVITGPSRLIGHTIAWFHANAPLSADKGEQYYCDNCTVTAVAISTGSTAGSWAIPSSKTTFPN